MVSNVLKVSVLSRKLNIEFTDTGVCVFGFHKFVTVARKEGLTTHSLRHI